MCVEYRSRVYDVTPPDDVIGHFIQGYVPFSYSSRLPQQLILRVEVARLEEPVRLLGHRQTYCDKIASEKIAFGGDQTAVPSGRKSFTKRPFFHCTSRPRLPSLTCVTLFMNSLIAPGEKSDNLNPGHARY